MLKKDYAQPAMEIVSLATMNETLLGASELNLFMIGPDVSFSTEKTFDDYFES